MADKKRPSLAVVIGMGKPHGMDHDEPDGDESGEHDDLEAAHEEAAKALVSAVKSGDASGVVEAFKSLYDLCAQSHDEDEAAEDEEPKGDEY